MTHLHVPPMPKVGSWSRDVPDCLRRHGFEPLVGNAAIVCGDRVPDGEFVVGHLCTRLSQAPGKPSAVARGPALVMEPVEDQDRETVGHAPGVVDERCQGAQQDSRFEKVGVCDRQGRSHDRSVGEPDGHGPLREVVGGARLVDVRREPWEAVEEVGFVDASIGEPAEEAIAPVHHNRAAQTDLGRLGTEFVRQWQKVCFVAIRAVQEDERVRCGVGAGDEGVCWPHFKHGNPLPSQR